MYECKQERFDSETVDNRNMPSNLTVRLYINILIIFSKTLIVPYPCCILYLQTCRGAALPEQHSTLTHTAFSFKELFFFLHFILCIFVLYRRLSIFSTFCILFYSRKTVITSREEWLWLSQNISGENFLPHLSSIGEGHQKSVLCLSPGITLPFFLFHVLKGTDGLVDQLPTN